MIFEDYEDRASYTLEHTNKVLGWLQKDLQHLKDDKDIHFEWRPLLMDRVKNVYRPPGVWCRFTGDRSAPGSRLLWWFPEPYHPLEVLAAYRGLGGGKSDNHHRALVTEDWTQVKKLETDRFAGWNRYTEAIAKVMFITAPQARILYHAFTPLHTNGTDREDELTVQAIQRQLYCQLLAGTDAPGFCDRIAWSQRSDWGVPTRMDFWGKEIFGRVEL